VALPISDAESVSSGTPRGRAFGASVSAPTATVGRDSISSTTASESAEAAADADASPSLASAASEVATSVGVSSTGSASTAPVDATACNNIPAAMLTRLPRLRAVQNQSDTAALTRGALLVPGYTNGNSRC